jgi:hypothetical protein
MEATSESRSLADRRSDLIGKLMREGARRAIEIHHKLGQDVVTWRDGKIAIVPAAELLAEFDKAESAEAAASKPA